MAITHVGEGALGATTSSSLAPAFPSGLATNDVLIAHMYSSAGNTPNPPSGQGWTQLATQVASGVNSRCTIFIKRYSSGDTTQSFTNGGTSGFYGTISAWRGVSETQFTDVTTLTNTGSSGNPVASSITTVTDEAMVIAFFSGDDNNDISSPTNSTTLTYGGTSWTATTGNDACFAAAHKIKTPAGSVGTISATQSTGQFRENWTAFTVALRPKPIGPIVNAGADVTFWRANTEFTRTATEDPQGSTITSRSWTIVSGPSGAGSTIGTAATLVWTPTVVGTYTLRYSATNANGTSTDDMVIRVLPSYVRGISVAQTNSSTVSVPTPAGVVEGDNMIAFCINDFIAATATGWERPSAAGTSADDSAFNIFRRTATASEPSSHTFDVGASTSATVAILVLDQDEMSVDWDVAPSLDTLQVASATSNPSTPSINIVDNDVLLLCVYGTAETSSAGHSSHSPPTGMTELIDYVGTGTSRDLHVAGLITSSGASGTKTATRDSGTGAYCSQAMSVRPTLAVAITPSGIDSSTVFGLANLSLSIPSPFIGTAEAFGTPHLKPEVDPTGIPSAESFGATRVTGGIIPPGIESAERFGAPIISNNGLGPTSIASAETFGNPVALRGAILINIEPGDSIASQEAVPTQTVNNYGLGPTGIPAPDEPHMGSVTLSVGPVFIEPSAIPSEEGTGEPTYFNYGLGPTGIPSEEAFGEYQVATLISNFPGIPSAEGIGSPVLHLIIYPDGIESEEQFGSTAGEEQEIRPRRIPQRQISRYELVCVAYIPNESGPPELIEIDAIDWTGLTITDELSRPQTLSGSAQVSRLTNDVVQRLESLDELWTELWVNRNGQRVFSGPLWAWNIEGEEISLEAQGVLSYLDLMAVSQDLTFKTVDQFVIVKDLIDHFQTLPYGNYGLDTSSITTSGVTRDITYLLKEEHIIGRKVFELGAGENGFDISADPLTRKVELHYPFQGVDRSTGEDAIIFDARNITSPGVSCSVAPGDLATEAIGTGSNTEGEGLVSIRENTELRSKIGRRVVMNSFEATDQASLDSQTQGLLNARGRSLMIPGPNVRVTVDSDISRYDVGDTVRFVLHNRLATEAAFRLRKRAVTVSKEGGTETATFQFV